jgi:glycosyltransferase involved in cell wall biosynthesis
LPRLTWHRLALRMMSYMKLGVSQVGNAAMTAVQADQQSYKRQPDSGYEVSSASLPSGVSIIVPVFNSEPILGELSARLLQVMTQLQVSFELIFVNDASHDQSWLVICELAARYAWVRGICLMKNYGQHNALLCGIRAAQYDVIVTMDDDLQHPPEEIPLLLVRLHEGHDVVYGTPEHETHGWLRDFASIITKIALRSAMRAEIARQVSAFRVFRTQLRDAFASFRNPLVSIDVVLTWGTNRFAAVKVRHEPRRIGQSNYSVAKLIRHAVNMITGFSVLPLQVASIVGLFFTLFGFGILVFVVGRYFIQGSFVPGFPFLASVIALFSGAQLFALGVIGEYLARMYFRVMDRPTYMIRTSLPSTSTRSPSAQGG